MSTPALSSPIIVSPDVRSPSRSPSIIQMSLQSQTSTGLPRASLLRRTGSPTSGHSAGSAGSPMRQYGIEVANNEYFHHMYSMVDFCSSDRKSLLKLAKSTHHIVRGGRVAAQARFEQFLSLLKALGEELDDWKWKEFEAEQTLWSLQSQEGDV
ncbi:uncharacterized protein HD556DRAFT_1308037 [Suillus plorans]|uniref:Uncharacterized protein n=1 Tax=Suillus plorans TaxID=116603 RepID=A0A9P7AR54_9AGAM|nr:uncharacterized protein HD556DRAFT_1313390 [Suillus plorans]XP_041160802.1 uncharacterized protein HD556DRAFT_1308037 [Suillus plorans]KAG1786641.1 hypothetical protein HD556DRAFT_1313390 [Suillus plorans]KAG1794691.1 hypothetical protein HD556DRAFT_1308037 [Suillus plorans]